MDRLPAEHPAAPTSLAAGDPSAQGRHRGEPDGLAAGRRRSPRGDDGRRTEGRPHGRRRAAAGRRPLPRGPAGRPSRPRNWRVRTKLIAVLVVPAVAFLVLASFNMAGQIGSAREFGRGETIAEFGRQVTALVHELQAERDLSAGYIAAGRPDVQRRRRSRRSPRTNAKQEDPTKTAAGRRRRSLANPMLAQRLNVDTALGVVPAAERDLGDVGPQATRRIDAARAQLDGLPQLRSAVLKKQLTEGAITGQYTNVITALSRRRPGDRPAQRQPGAVPERRRPHRAGGPEGDAVPGAGAALPVAWPRSTGSSSASSRTCPERWPAGRRRCCGSAPTPPRTSAASTTSWSTARPCSRSSGSRTT